MVGQASVHGGEPENILRILETAVRDLAHEFQNKLNILTVDIFAVFHPLADQPQDFQAAKHHLMLSRA